MHSLSAYSSPLAITFQVNEQTMSIMSSCIKHAGCSSVPARFWPITRSMTMLVTGLPVSASKAGVFLIRPLMSFTADWS